MADTTVKKIICSSCGAEFEDTLPKCPYCGSLNYKGAEAEYLGKLESMRQDMQQLEQVPEKELKKKLKKKQKFVIKLLILLAALAAILAVIVFRVRYIEPRDARADYLWEKENFPILDRLYQEKDLEALMDFYEQAVEENRTIDRWEHSGIFRWLMSCRDAREYLALEQSGETLNEYQQALLLDDYWMIFYCLSGSVTHVINEEEICLRPGELLFMNQHIEHAVIACGQEDLGINIIIRPAYFQNILTLINKDNILADFIINALEGDSCVGQYLYFTVSDNPCIQNLIRNAVFLLLQQPQNWHKLSEHTFALLFMHILSNAENILLDQKDEQSNVLMVVVRRYLAEHYDTGTLHELAAQIGYTPSSLSRMIKKYSGTTFKEIQTRQRMRVAMNQLSHTALPVSEIALSVGYENQNFFYKQFKKMYDMTPNEARLKSRR
jgi:AraC family transcriptional regulator, L-rhamnose operon regulatory protein RhaS